MSLSSQFTKEIQFVIKRIIGVKGWEGSLLEENHQNCLDYETRKKHHSFPMYYRGNLVDHKCTSIQG